MKEELYFLIPSGKVLFPDNFPKAKLVSSN